MSEIPPQFASYPRGTAQSYGSAVRLEALADGYFGLNNVFIVNICLALAANFVLKLVSGPGSLLLLVIAFAVIIGGLSYPCNRKLG